MNAAEYLARVGFDHLLRTMLGGPTEPDWADEDDEAAVAASERAAELADHAKVRDLLADPVKKPVARAGELHGARWLGMVISWPDRVPGLKCWAGRSTLPQIITQRRAALQRWSPEEGATLYEWTTLPPARPGVKKKPKPGEPEAEDLREGEGHSGIDSYPCVNALDAGYSPHAAGIPVAYRPALELLAVVGLEVVPLVSFAARVCGFVHGGRVWQFAVEDRDGDRKRWGELREYRDETGEESEWIEQSLRS